MRVPIYGATESLAAAIMPEIKKDKVQEPFPPIDENSLTDSEINEIKSAKYTGVVINAEGLDMSPTFSPVIYDTEGKTVYGIENLDYDKVISEGMVTYSETLEQASEDGRAGDNPLVINAVDVVGGNNSSNKVNAVVSVEDANKMLAANETSGVLENASVIFVK